MKRLAQIRAEGRAKEKQLEEAKKQADFDTDDDDERIVSLKLLARQLWCASCKEALTLENIESERRRGFGSTLLVKCHKCLLNNEVVTGRQGGQCQFDRNYLAVKGAVESGIKWSQLYKFCSIMKIPCPERSTFKKYEKTIVTNRINTEVNPLEEEHKLLVAQLAKSQGQIVVEATDNPAKKIILDNDKQKIQEKEKNIPEEEKDEEVIVFKNKNKPVKIVTQNENIQKNNEAVNKKHNNLAEVIVQDRQQQQTENIEPVIEHDPLAIE